MVETDIMSGFKKILVFWNQRLKLHKNLPEHFLLSCQQILKKNGRILVGIDIMVRF